MKTFDMTCAGNILYYPDFKGLPIKEGSLMTPLRLKNSIDHSKEFGGWVSYYTCEKWYNEGRDGFLAKYRHCHAEIKNKQYFSNTFLLDLINWGIVGKDSEEMTSKMHKMLISKDSPWADALTNVYFLVDKEKDRLLGVYVKDMDVDIAPELRRLFVNFLIAIRALSEHRECREAMKKETLKTGTLLGSFIAVTYPLGVWHNWISSGDLGKKWVESLFKKNHSLAFYGEKPALVFTNMCNGVYPPVPGEGMLTEEKIIEVEKELGYV